MELLRCSPLRASPEFHTKVWPRWTNPAYDSARVQPSRINQVIHNALGTGLQFFGSPLCGIDDDVCIRSRIVLQLDRKVIQPRFFVVSRDIGKLIELATGLRYREVYWAA